MSQPAYVNANVSSSAFCSFATFKATDVSQIRNPTTKIHTTADIVIGSELMVYLLARAVLIAGQELRK